MIPRLIHPVPVVIEQVNPNTPTDPTFREPIGPVQKTTITIQAQIKRERGQRLQPTSAGNDPTANAIGHLVVEIDALSRNGQILHVGDRIVSVGGATANYRVLALEDHAHYRGRPFHRYAYYADESQ